MTANEMGVVCPHCHFDHMATMEWPTATPQEMICVACGKKFRCWAERTTHHLLYRAEPC
jgi:DNA-directed RNA polymerase subunit RPC12/RpoP